MLNKYFFQFVLLFNHRKKIFLTTICISSLYKILQERWLGAKDRASNKGIPFTITKEDLLELWEQQNGLCNISKIPMTYELDNGRVFTNVSVDQKNPGQGYTKENIQLVCSAVNQLKSNWDMDTVVYICKQIVNNYGS